jgi:hypothetical protein
VEGLANQRRRHVTASTCQRREAPASPGRGGADGCSSPQHGGQRNSGMRRARMPRLLAAVPSVRRHAVITRYHNRSAPVDTLGTGTQAVGPKGCGVWGVGCGVWGCGVWGVGCGGVGVWGVGCG